VHTVTCRTGGEIKAEVEFKSVKAEVGNVEKETDVKAVPAIQEVAALSLFYYPCASRSCCSARINCFFSTKSSDYFQ